MTLGSWHLAVGRSGFAASAFCLFTFYFCLAACSIPNLESQACIDSRPAVREFYSFHFGNDMGLTPENLKLRERFLTNDFTKRLSGEKEGVDPFTTGTEEVPKAFRDGECKEVSTDRTEFRLLLFWKDDVRSEQRPINVETVKVGDKWLIDKVIRLER